MLWRNEFNNGEVSVGAYEKIYKEKRGKIFCWHTYHILQRNMNYVANTKIIVKECKKCGNIKYRIKKVWDVGGWGP